MIVNSITDVTKQRARISLDTGESFVLYKGEIRTLKLKEGEELTESSYRSIMETVLPRRAKLRAMNLLKNKQYTSYQLTRKLLDSGYPREICDEAVEYVKSYGYVNDEQYVKDYIRQEAGRKSIAEMRMKLNERGIERSTLENVLDDLTKQMQEYCETPLEDREDEIIYKTLLKRKFSPNATYEERQKLLAYFYRHGFDVDRVKKQMQIISES